jgi:hypothetical protein
MDQSSSEVNDLSGGAVFDDTQMYRYRLWREWLFGDGTCVFIMLNPSTATAEILDPTVTRCVGFTKSWGYKRIEVLNLFAWRSTDPSVLPKLADPVGPSNMTWILDIATDPATRQVICAWGKPGALAGQGDRVTRELQARGVQLWCLGTNGDGTPKHPLYLGKDTPRRRYATAGRA